MMALIVIGFDLIMHRHEYFKFKEIFAFPALFGFFSFIIIVLIGKQLRKIISKKEDYYD